MRVHQTLPVRRNWAYLYRAIDTHGQTVDFMLSEYRDEAAATEFFAKVIGKNGRPDKVVIDKSGSNAAGRFNMNCVLVVHGWCKLIEVLQVKYLKTIIEQDHRFKKKITRPMQTCNSFYTAGATLACIQVAHLIRKGQFEALSGCFHSQQFSRDLAFRL